MVYFRLQGDMKTSDYLSLVESTGRSMGLIPRQEPNGYASFLGTGDTFGSTDIVLSKRVLWFGRREQVRVNVEDKGKERFVSCSGSETDLAGFLDKLRRESADKGLELVAVE